MPTIAIFPKLSAAQLERIREAAPGWTLLYGDDLTDERAAEAEIVFGWRSGIERALLQPGSKVRWHQSWSAGMDHLDVDRFAERNVALTSANGVHANAISETIFAMMLAFTRNLHVYQRNQAARTWHHGGLKLELHGKTIGIVGVGAIGKETAKIAKAFDMTVLGVRRSGGAAEHVDEMYGLDALVDMLPRCDYVVNILPLTAETRHLFGAREFAAMKPTAFFVNVGRGATVRTEALVEALRDGRLAGAGLDVFEQEPLPADHPLWGMENVFVTPHTAGSTERYHDRIMDIFVANLKDYVNGNPPSINRLGGGKTY